MLDGKKPLKESDCNKREDMKNKKDTNSIEKKIPCSSEVKEQEAIHASQNEPKKITVTLKDPCTEEKIQVSEGMTLQNFFYRYRPRPSGNPIVAAKVNHREADLWTELHEDCLVEPVDLTLYAGIRIYERSLVLLLLRALKDLYPEDTLEVRHSISRGVYCEIRGSVPIRHDIVYQLTEYMRWLIIKGEKFERRKVSVEEAFKIFEKYNMVDKIKLLKKYPKKEITIYQCGDCVVSFYGRIVPDASYLKNFDLVFYSTGLILRFPDKQSCDAVPRFQEESRLFTVFQEHKRWASILGVNNIGELNEVIQNGKISDLIRTAEAIQEKKIAHIADRIYQDRENARLILIAGPSSSGKTTFSKRLAVQLKVNGLDTLAISLDDYFRNRDQMPVDDKGEQDFEGLDAIDIPLLNDHLVKLADGQEILSPRYDFTTGKRSPETHPVRLKPGQLLMLEGIHGLNPQLTPFINELQKFKIYISALTVLNIDMHNRIPTTDLRIIRRIVRDHRTRNYDALDTLKRWPSVRRGENNYIFPFQHTAHVMFNSGMIYELAVLKKYAEPLLNKIPDNTDEFLEAQRLLTFLSYFDELPAEEVPPTSILREFIGQSSFKY